MTMKRCVTCKELKFFSEFHPDKSKKDGRVSMCRSCRSAYMKTYYLENRDRVRKINDLWYSKNKVRHKEYCNEWVSNNRDRSREIKKKWADNNPGNVALNIARRNRTQKQATPKWANMFFIDEIYKLARLRTKMLGYKWHVDHIVPLRSPLVCGLQVENNLQVIPAEVNWRKANLSWPDMPQG